MDEYGKRAENAVNDFKKKRRDELTDKIMGIMEGEDYEVVMNTLVICLAIGGTRTNMTKQKFIAQVVEQMSEIYDIYSQGE